MWFGFRMTWMWPEWCQGSAGWTVLLHEDEVSLFEPAQWSIQNFSWRCTNLMYFIFICKKIFNWHKICTIGSGETVWFHHGSHFGSRERKCLGMTSTFRLVVWTFILGQGSPYFCILLNSSNLRRILKKLECFYWFFDNIFWPILPSTIPSMTAKYLD